MADINEVFREDFHGNMEDTDKPMENLESVASHTHEHQHAQPHSMTGLEGIPEPDVSQEDDLENDIIENSQPDNIDDMNDMNDMDNENVDNEEVELPDTENIESFYGNSINSEDIETSETNFNFRKIALYVGIPVLILVILYFAWPKIKIKLKL